MRAKIRELGTVKLGKSQYGLIHQPPEKYMFEDFSHTIQLEIVSDFRTCTQSRVTLIRVYVCWLENY